MDHTHARVHDVRRRQVTSERRKDVVADGQQDQVGAGGHLGGGDRPRAGQAPADVSMMSQVAMLKGRSTDLWAPLEVVAASPHTSRELFDARPCTLTVPQRRNDVPA